jgi:hypothetical protein
MVAGWRGCTFAAASANARRGSATSAKAIPGARPAGRGWLETRAPAPPPAPVGDELRAVGLSAGESDEGLARRDLAAVEGEARDATLGIVRKRPGKELAEAETGIVHLFFRLEPVPICLLRKSIGKSGLSLMFRDGFTDQTASI